MDRIDDLDVREIALVVRDDDAVIRANSPRGSRRNVAYHYDMGNDFYRLWLDPGMTYSSALYAGANRTLEEAQDNKLDLSVPARSRRSSILVRVSRVC